VVLLHGFGAPGTDLVPLADELAAPPGTRFVFPMAPLALEPGAPASLGPRAWWMIDMQALQLASLSGDFDELSERKPEGIDGARAKLESFLAALQAELAFTSERCVLGGFSQGAMLATETLLRSQARYAGLLVLSGTLLMRSEWTGLIPARRGLPVLQSHGTDDPILPFELAEELKELFVSSGVDVDWVPFRGGHGIPRPVLNRASALLVRALASTK
jgi:phospholipase/carboxylesterase